VIADRACCGKERRRAPRDRSLVNGIMYRRKRGRAKLQDSRSAGTVSCRVRVLGWSIRRGMMNGQFGYRRVRCLGLARNEFDFFMTVTAANIERSLHLAER